MAPLVFKTSLGIVRSLEGSTPSLLRQHARGRAAAVNVAFPDVVYNLYIMRRTQIYLTEEQGRVLEGRSRATGHTISQLIREAAASPPSPSTSMRN